MVGGGEGREWGNKRESLDQLELVRDLAALGLDILLRLLEVLSGRLGLESDLFSSTTIPSPTVSHTYVVLSRHLAICIKPQR